MDKKDVHPNYTPKERTSLLKSFPTSTSRPLEQVVAALNGASLSNFVTTVQQAAKACGIRLKIPDKKKDRFVVVCA